MKGEKTRIAMLDEAKNEEVGIEERPSLSNEECDACKRVGRCKWRQRKRQ